MSPLTKEILATTLRFLAIPLLIRQVFCRRKTTIAIYHDPRPEAFAKHLEYLSKRYQFISLDRLVDAISNKDWSHIPPKSLVITIDDGYVGNYRLLSLFKTYNIRPTIYVCTQLINTNRHFWFRTAGLGEQRYKKYRESLKRLADQERLAALRRKFNFEYQTEFPERQALNLDELIEMTPYVDFQAHTRFHPILTTCTEDQCGEEIEGCKRDLETLLEGRVTHFSYPNGDYTQREINIVRKCGYQSARSLDPGWNDVNTNLYGLKAMSLTDNTSINQLAVQVSGIVQLLKYCFHLPPFSHKSDRKMWQYDKERKATGERTL